MPLLLKEIPHQIVYKILFKMPCQEVVRMRKTCRYMNETVEENKEEFSKRIHVGVDMGVRLRNNIVNTELFVHCNSSNAIISLDSSFENRFSAISIKNLYLVTQRRARDNEGKMAAFLERLNLRCDRLVMNLFTPLEYLVQMANLVHCRETVFPPVILGGHEDDSPSPFLSAPRKSTFCLTLMESPRQIVGLLETLMNFKEVRTRRCEFSEEEVCLLFKALAALNEVGPLELLLLSTHYGKRNPFENEKFDFPPTTLLWKKKGILKNTSHGIKYIRKLDMASGKCAIIIEYSGRAKIRFIKNAPEDILELFLKQLNIENFDSTQRMKYLTASEDEQIGMLQELHPMFYDEFANKKRKQY